MVRPPTQEDNMAQKDLLSRLADAGEAAIRSISEAPGADRFLSAALALRDRLDELQRRVRGLEGLEQRLAELERKVDRLSRAASASSRSSSSGGRKTAASSSSRKTAASRAKKSG
jgi:hypothetical protein